MLCQRKGGYVLVSTAQITESLQKSGILPQSVDRNHERILITIHWPDWLWKR